MSDVSALFNKKKDKKAKKNVVKMDEVGLILERKARRQEERLEQEAHEDKRAAEEEAYLKKTAQEESDWIDYGDQNVGRLEGLKIKDMATAEEEEEDNAHSEHEKEAAEQETQKSGWGKVDKTEEEEPMPTRSEMAYNRGPTVNRNVPPSNKFGRQAANIDITNEEMFPTISAAEEIEKNHKDDKKNSWGQQKPSNAGGSVGGYVPPQLRSGSGASPWGNVSAQRADAVAAVRAISATSTPSSAPLLVPTPGAAPAQPKKNTYIAPHFRNKN